MPDTDSINQHKNDPGNHVPSESAAVEQIEREEKAIATDNQYERERHPEEPLLVVGKPKQNWFKRVISSKKFWLGVFGLAVLAVLFAWLITPSRLWAVNKLGLTTRVNVTTMVATESTPPALKNVSVTINGQQHHTNDQGKLQVDVPYGPAKIVISKQGYESITRDILLDFDPFFHYLGGKQTDESIRTIGAMLKSVGIPIMFTAKDYLTGQPITNARFIIGDIVAEPADSGTVAVILPATDASTIPMTAQFADNYAQTTVDLKVTPAPQEFIFVPAGKHYFISKRSGQFAVYSSNVDGSDQQQVVPASSAETGDIAFSASPDGKYGLLASTRESTRDAFGSLQQKLYIVDFKNNSLTSVDTALGFTFADWTDGHLVYTARVNQAGGTAHRLASVQPATAKQTNLATHQSFVVVRASLGNAVYINNAKELRTVPIKGGTDKLLGTNVARLAQSDTTRFVYQAVGADWHFYDVNTGQVGNTPTPASAARTFLAAPSASNQLRLVVDTVDGTTALIARQVADGKEAKLYSGNNLRGPVRWIGNVVVYRVGSADYAVSPYGGQPKKIADIEPGIARSNNEYFAFN